MLPRLEPISKANECRFSTYWLDRVRLHGYSGGHMKRESIDALVGIVPDYGALAGAGERW